MEMLRCKYARLSRGLSQVMLGKVVQLPTWRIVRIEGGGEPRLGEALTLADYLGLDPHDLMDVMEVDPATLHLTILEHVRASAVGGTVRIRQLAAGRPPRAERRDG